MDRTRTCIQSWMVLYQETVSSLQDAGSVNLDGHRFMARATFLYYLGT